MDNEDFLDNDDFGGTPNWQKRKDAWESILILSKELDKVMVEALYHSNITDGSFGLDMARDKLRECVFWAKRDLNSDADSWP